MLMCATDKAEGGESGADKGRGPRIYVGGIPTAVSETMVRNHFSQWGQVTIISPLVSKRRGLWSSSLCAQVRFGQASPASEACAHELCP